MSQPRRQFLRLFGVSAAMFALGESSLVAAASAKTSSAKNLSEMDYSSFAQLVGKGFRLARDGKPAVGLQLAKVVPLKSAKGYADERIARAQCFTLVFRSAERSALPEGIYDFSVSGVQTFQAFISPILGDGRSYQVVFNRT
ncbi:DUF6916 family protein [Dokdonella sp.]|uniref:DUF6916 family protein n=1 Tax=Dokdonella sp. TaxID=2291710 RepID=UPI0037832ECF